MTPKEKALEIIGKFYYTGIDEYSCKQCALIAVDELLKNNKILFEDVLNDQYWQEVKQEIENL